MANVKISALSAGTALAGTEVAPFVQSAATVKITANQIKTFTSASPTLVTPALGTPASGTLTNCTSATPTAGDASTKLATTAFLATPGPIGATTPNTGAFTTLSGQIAVPINAQSGTTYTVVTGDQGKLITLNNSSPIAVSIAQAGSAGFLTGWSTTLQNVGTGTATITPATSTIDGAATLALPQNTGVILVSDGTNYSTFRGTAVGASLSAANTFTASNTFSAAGAASAPGLFISGAHFSGGSGTTNFPQFLVQDSTATASSSWSTSGTAIGVNAHSTIGNLIALLVDGSEKFRIQNDGSVVTAQANYFGGTSGSYVSGSFVSINNGGAFTSSSSTNPVSPDTYLTRRAAANWNFGAADAASPVSQKLSVQGSRGGTDTNVAGGNLTLVPGLGTGNATVAQTIIQAPVVQASGTTQQTAATAITVKNSTATGLQFNGYGAGALSTDASGNITATSDERLKDIQGSFTAGLAELQSIVPIRYRWNATSGMETEGIYAGLSAQNIKASIPDATGQTPDGMLTVSDRALIATLINAVNELAQRVSVLEA